MIGIIFTLQPHQQAGTYELTSIVDFDIDLQSISEIRLTESYICNFEIVIEVLSKYEFTSIENFLRAYKYYTLAELTLEDLAKKERFLTDYHCINFLFEESNVDKVSIAQLLIAMSNLLRLANEYNVDELHFMSMRIVRKFSETLNKNIYFITEY